MELVSDGIMELMIWYPMALISDGNGSAKKFYNNSLRFSCDDGRDIKVSKNDINMIR